MAELPSFPSLWKASNRELGNDTLVDTSFQLISDFFHVNEGVLCFEHAEQTSSRGVWRGGGGGATGLLNKGGGSNRLPGLVTKQQAVEIPQVQASYYYFFLWKL